MQVIQHHRMGGAFLTGMFNSCSSTFVLSFYWGWHAPDMGPLQRSFLCLLVSTRQIIGTLEDRRFGTEGLCCHRMVEGPVHKYIMIIFGFFGVDDRQVNSRPNPEICL